MMDLREEHRDGVTVLLVKSGSGGFAMGHGILSKTVRNLVARGQKRIALDVSDIPGFDSAGIAELVQCMATTARKGGEFKLVNLHVRIREDLANTDLLLVVCQNSTGANQSGVG